MKICIIEFSPSGSINRVSKEIIKGFKLKGHEVQHIDITSDKEYFSQSAHSDYLEARVAKHDILLIGAPVYAHHMQYHMLELIESLPKPDNKWAVIAVPYVTYGGISSGVALYESAKRLNKTGRSVPLAMKLTAPHRMTRAFMPDEFNADKLQGEEQIYINELVNRIIKLQMQPKVKNIVSALNYNGLKTTIMAKMVFNEKKWHAQRYPKVEIDSQLCETCGKCVKLCPVNHFIKLNDRISQNIDSPCIHCLNCVTSCPSKAVKLSGDLEKGKAFMSKMIVKKGNSETPASAVYPQLSNKLLTSQSPFAQLMFRKMLNKLDAVVRVNRFDPTKALKAAGIDDALKILEIGCGSGYYSIPASKLIRTNAEYLAIDIHPLAVKKTKERLIESGVSTIRVEEMNALKTTLPDNSQDLILLFGVIPAPFVPLNELLPEIYRLLATNGKLAVWTMAPKTIKPYFFLKYGLNYINTNEDVIIFNKDISIQFTC